MTLETYNKLAKHIFRLLKVTEIMFPIGRTNKGNLGLKFTQNSDQYEIFLDAVPLPTKDILNDENNIELKRMIDKYLFEDEYKDLSKIVDDSTTYVNVGKVVDRAGNVITDKVLGKKRGRPKGSNNKSKKTEVGELVG